MQTYGDYNFKPADFVQPADITVNLEDLERENKELEARNKELLIVGARSNIEEPANLKKIITNIDSLDWFSAKEEGLGNLYEGLLDL